MNYLNCIRAAAALLMFTVLSSLHLHAQDREVIDVQTFTYGSPHDATFVFPPATERFEKILMHYKLRCPFDGPCGEWDYLAYIYLYHKSGKIDSTQDTATNFKIDGAAPESISYMLTPSWWYLPTFQKKIVRTATTSFDSALIGTGTDAVEHPFDTKSRAARSQYLWKSAELTAAGLKQGAITGMQFNIATAGAELRNLRIRMKSSALDSLTANGIDEDNWTTVHLHDMKFTTTGWVSIPFTTPFVWNGSTNIAVDISFDDNNGTGTTVLAGTTAFSAGVSSAADNQVFRFEGRDFIDVPATALNGTDSAITVSFWQYGDPARQPQEQSTFEAFDQYGRRVLNVHAPWGDTLIYWDAGSNSQGSYDRLIKKADDPSMYEGKWNHWIFTKNVKTGVMRIFLNGKAWAAGSSKRRAIQGIASFRIGSMADGSRSYDGMIDEFAVWSTDLDPATITATWRKSVGPTHPQYDKLLLLYNFDTGTPEMTMDASGKNMHGLLTGPPQSISSDGPSLNRDFAAVQRPNVVFEQGVYTSRIDSTMRVDSMQKAPMQIVLFADQQNPGVPTDTITVWPAYHRYNFNGTGGIIDSTPVAADATLQLVKTPYFRKFEKEERFEIGRYITPYGNGLNLGDGFVWTFDVSDYRTLLTDSVRLVSHNSQELVDIRFEMVKGVPPRDPVSIENLWVGNPQYGTSNPIEDFLTPRTVQIPAEAANVRMKMRTTGHGFGGTENCAEFCPKLHRIVVNGQEQHRRLVWKDDCGLNPVYPQGGTWVYNRTNWCPGDDVPTYDLELTGLAPGQPATLNYQIEAYTWDGQGSTPYYAIETQLVTYRSPNFSLDASVEAIKAPSTTDIYRRMNPICGNPVITIKNTGTTPLTSLNITYGVKGAAPSTHTWTGSLAFLESVDVELGSFAWSGSEQTFYASVSAPNGGSDQYANNNVMSTSYTVPPVYPSDIIIELKTNNNGEETSYELRRSDGSIVRKREDLEGQTTYRDTLTLADGCYEFRLLDTGGDGLDWWANRQFAGTGSLRIRRASTGASVRQFGADFGSEVYQQFTVGYDLSSVENGATPGASEKVAIYPNPTPGEFSVDLRFASPQNVFISVRDMLGKTIQERRVDNTMTGSLRFDLTGNPPGIYMVSVRTDHGVTSSKIVVE